MIPKKPRFEKPKNPMPLENKLTQWLFGNYIVKTNMKIQKCPLNISLFYFIFPKVIGLITLCNKM